MATYAVIDLGSNTFHLLIAEYKQGALRPIYKKRFFTKLSDGGVDYIKPKRYQEGLEALSQFADILLQFGNPPLRVLGTAVLRQATNRHDFIYEAELILNAQIEIIDGDSEADYIYKGVTLIESVNKGRHLIMDIGGGSTEFIVVVDGQKIWAHSYPLGIGYLHAQFHDGYPMPEHGLAALKDYIIVAITELKNRVTSYDIQSLVGASGSFEILQSMTGRDTEKMDLDAISIDELHNIYKTLNGKNVEELYLIPGLPKDRAKLALIGMTLMKTICDELTIPLIQVSPFALKEGVIRDMDETEKMSLKDLILNRKGTVVDVRSYQEFLGGHVADSVLVPLSEIKIKKALLQSLRQPLILVCRSGKRSGQATEIINQMGIMCINGGAWTDVNYLKSKN